MGVLGRYYNIGSKDILPRMQVLCISHAFVQEYTMTIIVFSNF